MYQVQAPATRADAAACGIGAMIRACNAVSYEPMPAEPRIVPVPCPFGTTGGVVYVYYIDAPQPALVDTGVAASPGATIEPALNAQGLSLKDVKWILATHGHWDHIGGAHAARSMAADDVQIALHAADRELLQSRRAHMAEDGYQALRFRYLD